MGPDLGHRRRRRDGGVRDRPRGRGEDPRHVGIGGEAGDGAHVGRRPRPPPCRRGGCGEGTRRCRSRRRDGRRGDLEGLPLRRQGRWEGGRLRSDHRAEPAGAAASLLVEAADRLRLDDGDAGGLPRRLRPRPVRPSRACTSTRPSRSPTSAPRTSGWRPASSSARSSSRFRDGGVRQPYSAVPLRAARPHLRPLCTAPLSRPGPTLAPLPGCAARTPARCSRAGRRHRHRCSRTRARPAARLLGRRHRPERRDARRSARLASRPAGSPRRSSCTRHVRRRCRSPTPRSTP